MVLFTMKSLPTFISFHKCNLLCLHIYIKTLIGNKDTFGKIFHIDHHPGWRWLLFFPEHFGALVWPHPQAPLS